MTRETEQKLACSLTAQTTDLLPFLPYLLQDFWELGSDPDIMVGLIGKHTNISADTKILDLACGKGAVSIKIAQKLKVKVKGIDIIPEFVQFCVQKAQEMGVGDLCEFTLGDVNEAVKTHTGYDCVVFGAVGDVLGDPAEMLNKLKATIKPGGYILIDDGYLPDEAARENVKYNSGVYHTHSQWMNLFAQAGLVLIEAVSVDETSNLDSDSGMAAITARANELIERHPDKKDMFEGYIRSQQNEYDDIDGNIVCVTWILKKL